MGKNIAGRGAAGAVVGRLKKTKMAKSSKTGKLFDGMEGVGAGICQ
jgi:hypothetical protein